MLALKMTFNPVESFKSYYQDFDNFSIDELANIYDENVIFVDPIHKVEGIKQLQDYFKSICSGLTECRFHFETETATHKEAWLKWHMDYAHPKLKGGERLKMTGVSHIVWDTKSNDEQQKIILHEDFYDMGSMLYEHIPLLGKLILFLKNRL